MTDPITEKVDAAVHASPGKMKMRFAI